MSEKKNNKNQIIDLFESDDGDITITIGNKTFSLVTLYNLNKAISKEDSASTPITHQSPEYIEGATIAEGSEIIVTINK